MFGSSNPSAVGSPDDLPRPIYIWFQRNTPVR